MRFLADECLVGHVVRALRSNGHDVNWARELYAGESDRKIIARSLATERILLTHDWDFGELSVRLGLKSAGIVIVNVSTFEGDMPMIAAHVVRRIEEECDDFAGKLTVIAANRTRRRNLS